MKERVERRVRQTCSLNRYELMKDTKIKHIDYDRKKRDEKRLLERNNRLFFGNVNKVTAYYDTDGWVREYNEGRKVEKSKLKNLKKQNDTDFGKTSKAFHALDNLYNLKQSVYGAKLDSEKQNARYYVNLPKPVGGEDPTMRILSATLPLRKTKLTVLDPDDDFDKFEIYDPIHVREQREKLKRRKNLEDFTNPNIDFEVLTLEGLLDRRKQLATRVKDWEDALPEKLEYMKQQKIENIKASVEHHICNPKPNIPSSFNIDRTKRAQSPEKSKSKGFFIRRQKTATNKQRV